VPSETDGRTPAGEATAETFDDRYFDRWNYADRGRGRFTMYWFARRYYAAMVRRFAPSGGHERQLFELGCGLGDLLGLLQDDFTASAVDLIPSAVETARRRAPRAHVDVGDGTDLDRFGDATLTVVVSLHVMEHLPDPRRTMRDVARTLRPGGVFIFATPHPEYALRRFKDRATDAIGKDPTHINCHVPEVWARWGVDAGLRVVRQWGDGLWDVPYVKLVPAPLQLAVFGLPAFVQVVTRSTIIPTRWAVNQINVFTRPAD
jgi:SAM-dependent methyltransferase